MHSKYTDISKKSGTPRESCLLLYKQSINYTRNKGKRSGPNPEKPATPVTMQSGNKNMA